MTLKSIPDNDSIIEDVIVKSLPNVKPSPHCKKHGAMNKVSAFKGGGGYWRCCVTSSTTCRTGCMEESTNQ